jgi:hypothetical protein
MLRTTYLAHRKTGSAKESLHVTEIETNGLLNKVRRPASASGETVAGPGGQPARSAQLRSWRPAFWLALRLAAMPDYFLSTFRS